MRGRGEMLLWFYRGETEVQRHIMITSSVMGARSRVRTAGPRLSKAQRGPSAFLQPGEFLCLPLSQRQPGGALQ